MQPQSSAVKFPEPLSGFEQVRRRWDRKFNRIAARILPGEFYVTASDEVVVTLLGSCVSACVRDPVRGIGGMNHFMLPEIREDFSAFGEDIISKSTRYGNHAMEHLINSIMSLGGRRESLEVKVFGGGNLIPTMREIGSSNAEFVLEYLRAERMNLLSGDLGGTNPRLVAYYPASGRARVKKMPMESGVSIARSEEQYRRNLCDDEVAGSVELF